MSTYAEHGLYAFDMADHYGPAEDIFGQFRADQVLQPLMWSGLESSTLTGPLRNNQHCSLTKRPCTQFHCLRSARVC
jgi:hypothetical protein